MLVACADPGYELLEQRLIEALEAPVKIVIAAEDEMAWVLDVVYSSNVGIDDALRDFEERAESRVASSSPTPTMASSSRSTRTRPWSRS